MLEAQRRLDQPGDAGGRLGVADVGLDRADHGSGRPGARPWPRTSPSALELDRVAGARAGAVRLDVADARRVDARRRGRPARSIASCPAGLGATSSPLPGRRC